MQNEAVKETAAGCQIIEINSLWSRRIKKQQQRMRCADDKFATLAEKSQKMILSHMIGYIRASKDLISSERQARPDEVSRTFSVMEDMVNEAWKGGMI